MEGIKRNLFPIVGEKPYFNACSIGPLSIPVKHALETHIAQWNEFGGYSWAMHDGWTDEVEKARNLFAKLIGADRRNIAFSFGNSVAFSSVMSAFQFSKTDNIIFNDLDFPAIPANIMAHQGIGPDYKVVQSTNGFVEASDYEEKIDSHTKLITACEIASNTGARVDIKHLTDLAHDQEIPLFVDSYQSTGVIPMNVNQLDVDFVASGCLKWLVGGFGISFLYVRDDWIDELNPSSIGWMGIDDPFQDLFNKLRTTLHRPQTSTKFQYGTPYPFGAASAVAGMSLIEKIGIQNIYNHDMKITDFIIQEAQNRAIKVKTPIEPDKRGSIVNLQIPDAGVVVQRLQEIGFILDMRSQGIRVAPHFYNNSEDVLHLFDNIQTIRAEHA